MRAAAPVLAAAIFAACAAASEFSQELLRNPRAYVIADRAVENRWNELFMLSGESLSRSVSSILRGEERRGLEMLCARLIYRGDPWSRHRDDDRTVSRVVWQRRNGEVCAAILRQLRWRTEPELAGIYAEFLADEADAGLAVSALVNLLQIDGVRAKDIALRLAVPGIPQSLRGSSVSVVREDCTAFLAENFGVDAAEAQQAISHALLRTTGAERLHAVGLLPRGALPQLVQEAIVRLGGEREAGSLGDEDLTALVDLCACLRGVSKPDCAATIYGLVVRAERILAAPAASALATGVVTASAEMPIDPILERIRNGNDPALGHALLELVVRLNTTAARSAAGPDSPWSRLAEHRDRLGAMAWEGMVK
jgi:hypothetical protein